MPLVTANISGMFTDPLLAGKTFTAYVEPNTTNGLMTYTGQVIAGRARVDFTNGSATVTLPTTNQTGIGPTGVRWRLVIPAAALGRSDPVVATFTLTANTTWDTIVSAVATPYSPTPADTSDAAITTAINNPASTTRIVLNDLEGGYDARRSGVVADPVANQRVALVQAMTDAMTAGKVLRLPPGTIRNTGAAVQMPDGLEIFGLDRSITTIDGPGFILGSNNRIEKVGFVGTNVTGQEAGVYTRGSSQSIDSEVANCKFKSFPNTPALRLGANAGGSGPETSSDGALRTNVRDNVFTDCSIAGLVERAYGSTFRGNKSVNAAATGAHFTAYGASGCRWLDNQTEGGITGVLLLGNRQVAATLPLRNNVIQGNRVHACSEEGISLDVAGNSSTMVSVADWGTIASIGARGAGSGGICDITLDAAFSATTPASQFFGLQLVVTTGPAAGSSFFIYASTGRVVSLLNVRASVYAQLAAGAEVVIGLPLINNSIVGNTVEDAGTSSIMLYGLVVGNSVIGNTCLSYKQATIPGGAWASDLSLFSLDGLVTSNVASTTRAGRAPAVGNRVHHNTLNRCDLRFGVINFGAGAGSLSATNVRSDNTLINADSI